MRDLDVLISFLVRLHETNDSLTGMHVSASGLPLLPEAIQLGWLTDRGIAGSLECTFCDVPHRAQVMQYTPGYKIDCPNIPATVFERSDVAEYRTSLDGILRQLQQSLGLRASGPHAYAGDQLFDLGYIDATRKTAGWSALFGFGLNDEVAMTAALETINKRLRSGPGLLLTVDPLPLCTLLPKRYVLARPSDIWTLGGRGLELRSEAIEALLGQKPKRTTGAGRKSQLENVRRAIENVKREHSWPTIPEDQWRLLDRFWSTELGRKPKRSTMLVHLAKLALEARR
jgi:hypothetical protein